MDKPAYEAPELTELGEFAEQTGFYGNSGWEFSPPVPQVFAGSPGAAG